MAVQFDAESGRLRLSRQDFESLVRTADQTGGPTDEVLVAGAATSAGVHPMLGPALDAVLAPVCALRLAVAGPSVLHLHQGWASLETVSLLLAVRDEQCELVTPRPPFLAAGLARIVHLGPRRVGTRSSLTLASAVVDDLWSGHHQTRANAFLRLDEKDGAWAWRLEATWQAPSGESTGHGLAAVDGPDGVCLIQPEAHGARLHPTTASVIWRAFTALLPTNDELEPSANGTTR